MTDAIHFRTLTAAIAAQIVNITRYDGKTTRLKIRDVDKLPVAINVQDAPILSPRPFDFVSGMIVKRDSYGADMALKSINYDLTYTLFYYPMGEGSSWLAYYGTMITAIGEILLYFATHTDLAGSHEIIPGTTTIVAQADATGIKFHGCEFVFHVMQFLED